MKAQEAALKIIDEILRDNGMINTDEPAPTFKRYQVEPMERSLEPFLADLPESMHEQAIVDLATGDEDENLSFYKMFDNFWPLHAAIDAFFNEAI